MIRITLPCFILILAASARADAPASAAAPVSVDSVGSEAADPAEPASAVVIEALSDEHRQAFIGSPEDPPAKKLLGVNAAFAGRHYLAGDEWHLDLFSEEITGLGGGYVGVGSDQAYLLMGWARPDLAWLIDYDPLVSLLHRAYRAMFLAAETPEAFLALWQKSGAAAAEAAIREHEGEPETILKVYAKARASVAIRLGKLRRQLNSRNVPSYLDDPAQYGYLREMVRSGRVRPMLADLLGAEGIKRLGDAARELGVPVRILYLSNAEEYWPYKGAYRENIQALPFDERSVILRTRSTFSRNRDYQYNVQSALGYCDLLAMASTRRVNDVAPKVKARASEYPLTRTPRISPEPGTTADD